METKDKPDLDDELRPHYDLSKLKLKGRGLYANRNGSRHVTVRLEADVAKAFPTEAAVNEALRLVMRFAQSASKTLEVDTA